MKKQFTAVLLSGVLACSAPATILTTAGVTADSVHADTLTGWVHDDFGWRYYTDNTMKTGWLKYKSSWYYLDPETGKMKSSEWFTDQNGYVYYAKSWGGIYINTVTTLDGTSYHFDLNGRLVGNTTVLLNGNTYFVADGKPVTGWYQNADGAWFYYNKNGSQKKGWLKYNGNWFYLDPETGVMKTSQWFTDQNGYLYYARSWDGIYLNTTVTINGDTCQFDSNGRIAGTTLVHTQDGARIVIDGKPSTGWYTANGFYYYLKADGTNKTGWLLENNHWYYLDPESNIMKSSEWFTDQNGYLYYARSWGGIYLNTTVTINGTDYQFDKDGRVVGSPYVTIDGVKYQVTDRKPVLVTGWIQEDDTWYYLDENGDYVTGWLQLGNNWYYLNDDGSMKTNEKFEYNGHWYFVKSWGGMYKGGWLQYDGDWYYLHSWGGTYNSGKTEIDGNWYYFYPDSGIMACDVTIDDEYYNTDGILTRQPDESSDDSPALDGNTQSMDLVGMSEGEIVELMGPVFTESQRECGILACISMAQFILESGYGCATDLARNANNCFGMKINLSENTWAGSTWDGVSTYTKYSDEWIEDDDYEEGGHYVPIESTFRAYPCIEDSIADHAAYLIGAQTGGGLRYPGINQITDYREAAELIYAGGYATSPTYADKLCEIIERWNLTRFNL